MQLQHCRLNLIKIKLSKYKIYGATLAYWYVKDDYLNKRNLDKISTFKRLKTYVYKGLLKDWSPEQISNNKSDSLLPVHAKNFQEN